MDKQKEDRRTFRDRLRAIYQSWTGKHKSRTTESAFAEQKDLPGNQTDRRDGRETIVVNPRQMKSYKYVYFFFFVAMCAICVLFIRDRGNILKNYKSRLETLKTASERKYDSLLLLNEQLKATIDTLDPRIEQIIIDNRNRNERIKKYTFTYDSNMLNNVRIITESVDGFYRGMDGQESNDSGR
jgi:hypothetical protein